MIKISKKIKNLFYDPETDSIASLLRDIKKTHLKLLKKTDLVKGTLIKSSINDKDLIDNFKIPEKSLDSKYISSTISNLFDGVSRWHFPNTMYNAAPPPLLPTVITKMITSLYNPNLALYSASGKSLLTEQKVIKAIAEYVGWNRESAGGVFTWGGKATTMYGIKFGIKNCSPNSAAQGIKEDIIVLSTKVGHPSHISDSEWLGIGSSNVVRLGVDENSQVNLNEMEEIIRKAVKEKKKIATIIISGGTTNDMVVDTIDDVVNLRDKITKELELEYKPHIHVDTVVAFPWIFFKDYEFEKNPLNIEKRALARISKIKTNLKNLHMADSFGVDFHKMGFCPYISSVFMIKDKMALSNVKNAYNWPFLYSMENSRPADGPNSAFMALSVLGVEGFQILIGHLTEIAVHLQDEINATEDFEVINKTGLGTAVMFIPRIPKHITISTPEEEVIMRNSYTMAFIEKLADLGNPFYIDKIPSDSTGGNSFPYTSLKAYIMSPYSSKKSNIEFVSFMIKIKKEIDQNFNFKDKSFYVEEEHPLKNN
ncbi:hypothetical protein A2467_00810 [Candidatus Nomurabacteria bacterium RIFOXYC2_FULL_36_8]|nr:MAG: hypothetical protein UR97_C0002G0172 [Candidatus Nomurabacteria bacterium GW2011_GWE2_36_115]KKP94578.1 MAG: hypothetical protein US00_C0001G0172 [Candidatus Nomurabacteria bacterium GW2011_GWF2_36_126]KKP97040.1 MAG: hypothetical protein US04_C0001G0543 [Candidatus Nomurabacteria bacterium GW2011_GWD2_36_14]KKP99356.1 MAG: hypothetical protein US08_C0001G0038 [Candidatus Nomurabacteria bacterium GW2011_GWF2_36_19]KKQ05787.1 MAG: hypothetical protein US17_C0002G0171 [Candidatus Nomuraba